MGRPARAWTRHRSRRRVASRRVASRHVARFAVRLRVDLLLETNSIVCTRFGSQTYTGVRYGAARLGRLFIQHKRVPSAYNNRTELQPTSTSKYKRKETVKDRKKNRGEREKGKERGRGGKGECPAEFIRLLSGCLNSTVL